MFLLMPENVIEGAAWFFSIILNKSMIQNAQKYYRWRCMILFNPKISFWAVEMAKEGDFYMQQRHEFFKYQWELILSLLS